MSNNINVFYREDIKDLAPIVLEGRDLTPNPILTKTTQFQFVFDEQANDSSVAINANGTARRQMTNDKSGLIDIRDFKGVFTDSNMLVHIYDSQFSRYLSNRPLHCDTVFGTGLNPYEIPAPLKIHPTQTLIFDFTDLSGNPNNARLALNGQKYYFDSEKLLFENLSIASKIYRPYWYTTDTDISLTVGTGINTFFFTVINEADFYWDQIMTRQTGPFLIKMTNTAVGRAFTNGWIHSSNFGNNAQTNYVRTFEAMLLQRRTNIRFDIINLHTATNNIYITLGGTNYYYER